MRIHIVVAASVIAVLSLAAAARAQEPGDLERRFSEQEERLRRLEGELDALRAERAAPAPVSSSGETAPVASSGGASLVERATQAPADARFEWGYEDGFFVRTKIGDAPFTLRPRARLAIDYRLFPDPREVPSSEFVLRRARIGFDGTFADFGFDFEVDPIRGGIPLGDFWLQYQALDEARVRLGHFKSPFGLDDGMTSDLRLDLIERPMVEGSGASVAPDFLPGAMIFGSLSKGAFQSWISAHNEVDSNRVLSENPLFCARLQSDVGGFSIGAAGVWSRRAGTGELSAALLTPGQFQLFAPVSIHGWEQRYEVDASFYAGPAWVRAEWVYARQLREGVLAGRDAAPLVTQGAIATAGCVVWGPRKDSPRPHVKPFDGWQWFSGDIEKKRNARTVGAELAVRGEWVQAGDGDGVGGAAKSTGLNAANVDGNGATGLGLGANVSPIENVRFMLDYEHLWFQDKGRGERSGSHQADEVLFRAQLDF